MRASFLSLLFGFFLLCSGCQPMQQVDSSAKSPSSSKPASNGSGKKGSSAKGGGKSGGKAAPKDDKIVPPPNKPGYAPLP